jgi:hypothetical protein
MSHELERAFSQEIIPQHVQLLPEENFDRVTGFLACGDKRLEGRQLVCTLELEPSMKVLAKLYFFQSG